MNRCIISISRCIPLLLFKSERETKQESMVAMLPCKNPLYTEIVVPKGCDSLIGLGGQRINENTHGQNMFGWLCCESKTGSPKLYRGWELQNWWSVRGISVDRCEGAPGFTWEFHQVSSSKLVGFDRVHFAALTTRSVWMANCLGINFQATTWQWLRHSRGKNPMICRFKWIIATRFTVKDIVNSNAILEIQDGGGASTGNSHWTLWSNRGKYKISGKAFNK